jgi:hypothetical protein
MIFETKTESPSSFFVERFRSKSLFAEIREMIFLKRGSGELCDALIDSGRARRSKD